MDHFELLKITEGKNRKQSLVFHIVDHKNEKHYELLIDYVCQNTFSLRYFLIFVNPNNLVTLTIKDA